MGKGHSHIGNVAEYNRQFFPERFRGDHLQSWDMEGHHYAGLALFYSADPGPVFLPLPFDASWLDLQRRHLQWPHVTPYWTDGKAEMSDAIVADPAAIRLLEGRSAPLLWGRSPGTLRLQAVLSTGAASPTDETDVSHLSPGDSQAFFESKREAHRRFIHCARECAEVRVARQDVYSSTEAAALALATYAATTCRPAMLKSDFGVGGFGTRLVLPSEAATPGQAVSLLDELAEDDAVFTVTPLLVEEYVEPRAGGSSQLTYDGEVTPHGLIDRGTGLMRVEGTHYRGAVVGPGVLPAPLECAVTQFGRAVGALLAEEGYLGWFDVDFVVGHDGRITPTEINARRTGPCVAMSIAENFALAGRPGVVVLTEDMLPLPRAVPEERLQTFLRAQQRELEKLGVALIPTLVTASSETIPYAGFAVAADSAAAAESARLHIAAAVGALSY